MPNLEFLTPNITKIVISLLHSPLGGDKDIKYSVMLGQGLSPIICHIIFAFGLVFPEIPLNLANFQVSTFKNCIEIVI